MRFPGMRNDLGTQVGAKRKIPAEASIACLTKSASVLLGGAGGFLAGGASLELFPQKDLAAQLSLEARQRVEQILAKQDPAAPGRLRVLRAIEVLEHTATPAALRFLETLAKGAPEALLTREARAAVQRLARWSSLQ